MPNEFDKRVGVYTVNPLIERYERFQLLKEIERRGLMPPILIENERQKIGLSNVIEAIAENSIAGVIKILSPAVEKTKRNEE